jgi:tetratricopeptide (TPR) repeat protein
MNGFTRISILVICSGLISGMPALAAEQLSDRVRQTIDAKGAKGAQQEMPALLTAAMGDLEADEAGMLALADEYVAAGDFQAALFVLGLQSAIANSPNVTIKMGDIYLAQGVAPLAAALYQQALQADPDNEIAKQKFASASQQSSAYGIPIPPPPPPKVAPPAAKESPLVIVPQGPRGGSHMMPYVLITDLEASRSVDWSALRTRANTNYPNRWDDLTLVDACLWIPPDELRDKLNIEGRITARYTDAQCKFYVHATDSNKAQMLAAAGAESVMMLQVYVELHDSTDWPRESEGNIGGSSQYTSFDAGARDLIVHTHHKSKHLYVYPRGGRTMWRLGYKAAGPERDVIYDPAGQPGAADNLGMRYMQLLVEKYGRQL